MTDYYKTLGLDKSASSDDIKQAYRRLASKMHPDKGGSTEDFQKLEEAYRTLSDPEKRAEYDNPRPQFHHQSGFPFDGFPFGDFFAQFHRPQQPQASIFRTSIQLTLEQVYSGSTHSLNIQTKNGNTIARLNSPPGIENGQQVKYDGIVDRGSIIVTWLVAPHLLFSRAGSDIISDVKVNVLDLIIGTKLNVRSIGGREYEVNVPPRTQPGTILRIPNAGLPVLNTTHYGDYRLVIHGIIPPSIPESVINAIKETKE